MALQDKIGLVLAFLAATSYAQTQLAATPPRGWNSWNPFQWENTNFTEDDLKATAEVIQREFLQYGYDTVTADEFWELSDASAGLAGSIDKYGRALPDVAQWPSSANGTGFKAMADYVHSLGLKFGIHVLHTVPQDAIAAKSPILNGGGYTVDQIAIPHSCPWNKGWYGVNMSHPAGQAYINSVYQLYADWGIDFIKNDCTFAQNMDASNIWAVRKAMDRTGHTFVYSLSPGGDAQLEQARAINNAVHMYRVTGDWHGPDNAKDGWQEHLRQAALFVPMIQASGYQGQSWPDLDMLANTMGSDGDERIQMSLWCMARSPLIIGRDVRGQNATSLWQYTNGELLDINSASSNNRQVASTHADNGDYVTSTWTATSTTQPGVVYVAFINVGKTSASMSVKFSQLGLTSTACNVRDLWQHKDLGVMETSVTASVLSRDAAVFALSKCQ